MCNRKPYGLIHTRNNRNVACGTLGNTGCTFHTRDYAVHAAELHVKIVVAVAEYGACFKVVIP